MSTCADSFLTVEELKALLDNPAAASERIMLVLRTLTQDDEDHRTWAIEVLDSIENPPESRLTELLTMAKGSHITCAYWACKLIARMATPSTSAQRDLREVITNHPDMTVREEAVLAMAKQTSLSDESIEALRRAAATGSPRLKRLVQTVLPT